MIVAGCSRLLQRPSLFQRPSIPSERGRAAPSGNSTPTSHSLVSTRRTRTDDTETKQTCSSRLSSGSRPRYLRAQICRRTTRRGVEWFVYQGRELTSPDLSCFPRPQHSLALSRLQPAQHHGLPVQVASGFITRSKHTSCTPPQCRRTIEPRTGLPIDPNQR